MWNEVNNNNDLAAFIKKICSFHDSCIKEIKYLSGAYVDDELSMHPVNDRRILKVIIQRQFKDFSTIEMEFEGLKFLKLFPYNEKYTCEISDATMILKNDCIYWCDCGNLSEIDLENYSGTIICASKLRWRSVDKCMGDKEFYISNM